MIINGLGKDNNEKGKNGKGKRGKGINEVITRWCPNLETVCFLALLNYYSIIKKKLGFTSEEIDIKFVDVFDAYKKHQKLQDSPTIPKTYTTAFFNIAHFKKGGKRWDQHGRAENQGKRGCTISSLCVVLEEYNFLKDLPYLENLIMAVAENDINGRGISFSTTNNLRELLNGLNALYPDDPSKVASWGLLAFCGIFELLKSKPENSLILPYDESTSRKVNKILSETPKDIFSPDVFTKGVELYLKNNIKNETDRQQELKIFSMLTSQAGDKLKTEWEKAVQAVKKAEEEGYTKKMTVEGVELKIISVKSDSIKTSAAGRAKGYRVVIQVPEDKSGRYQIFTSKVKNGGQTYQIDLGNLSARLRYYETVYARKKIRSGQNWSQTGYILFDDGTFVPGYLPEFRTTILYTSLSSKNAPKSKIGLNVLMQVISTELSNCLLIEDNRINQPVNKLVA